jgi:hypothetical protein
MTMTVGELKELLQDLDDEMEVRLAHQPSWPFEYSISGAEVVDLNEPDPDDTVEPEDEEHPDDVEEPEPNEILYLAEGTQLGYLPGVVSRLLGWR